MPLRDGAPPGSPCWADLSTSDPGQARAFYAELLGWEASEPDLELGGYFNFIKDGAVVAGCMAAGPGTTPNEWTVYLATDDADATVEAARACGGEVLVPATPVAKLGTMAVVADPGNATIGIWQPDLHRGFGRVWDVGSPRWFELYTRDYRAAVSFYRDVFKLEARAMTETPSFRYTTLRNDGQDVAGIMDGTGYLPAWAAPYWTVYFAVTEEAFDAVTDLGGRLVEPPESTRYGPVATVADPMGAQFKLVALREAPAPG